MSKREIALLLRRLFTDYRRGFHERAPEVEAPVPLLDQKRVDVVTINGGRALHFFFSDPHGSGPHEQVTARRGRATRLHDVTLWPPTAEQQKQMELEGPDQQREIVRRVARIDGELYVHFVLYPEDGDLFESIGAVGERLAEREVARAEGAELAPEVPGESVRVDAADGSDGVEDRPVARSGRRRRVWDPELDPAP